MNRLFLENIILALTFGVTAFLIANAKRVNMVGFYAKLFSLVWMVAAFCSVVCVFVAVHYV